ncbi:MAG TPA: hypothetical protein VFD66_14475 [Verrucomicrobiae bacterium]|nr:hypothetical protein [Verrucomicrobiae bacterium]
MKTRFVSLATAVLLGSLCISCTATRNETRSDDMMGAGHGAKKAQRMGPGMMAGMQGCPCCVAQMPGPGMMPPPPPPMRRRQMMQQRRDMMEHHEQMMVRWKSMQSELDQKIAKMNQATGQDKVDAMADVINTLVAQRNEIANHLIGARKHMMDRMQDQRDGMRGPPSQPGANPPPEEQK